MAESRRVSMSLAAMAPNPIYDTNDISPVYDVIPEPCGAAKQPPQGLRKQVSCDIRFSPSIHNLMKLDPYYYWLLCQVYLNTSVSGSGECFSSEVSIFLPQLLLPSHSQPKRGRQDATQYVCWFSVFCQSGVCGGM